MDIACKNVVVTGAASGIGRALAVAFAEAGASGIACADREAKGAEAIAEIIGGKAYRVDVSDDTQMAAMIGKVEAELSPLDIFVSNAGIFM
jgi:NAD(P)-dependent dehydrogenase (short-subunit alcohol dehydrogenase family)